MSEDVPISLFPTGGIYLKNLSLITIEIRLPEIRNPGITVSNWEIMEKIKEKSKPENYNNLRVSLSSREIIRFEGEFETVKSLRKINLMLNGKTIKLKGFQDPLKIRTYQTESPYPNQHDWEDYYNITNNIEYDEYKPGERPDTVHIKGLPVKWFVSKESVNKPCPKILTDAFQKFGKIRQVGIYDSTGSGCHKGFSSFGPGAATQILHFEAYIQYNKYSGFIAAMEGLRNVQLLRLQAGGQALAKINVDFDRSGFLSDRAIKRRLYFEEKERQEKEEQQKRIEQERKEEERQRAEAQAIKDKEEEERRLRKQEEKKQRKREQQQLAEKLKQIAIQRRTEALSLMSILLTNAAETKYNNDMKEKTKLEAKQLHDERNELIYNVQQLEQRRIALKRELDLRKYSSVKHKKRKTL